MMSEKEKLRENLEADVQKAIRKFEIDTGRRVIGVIVERNGDVVARVEIDLRPE